MNVYFLAPIIEGPARAEATIVRAGRRRSSPRSTSSTPAAGGGRAGDAELRRPRAPFFALFFLNQTDTLTTTAVHQPRRGPRMSTDPHTLRPVRITWGLPSAGASLRWWRALATTASTSSIDALAASGRRISTEPNFTSSSITTMGPANRMGQIEVDGAHPSDQRQPGEHRPFPLALQRTQHPPQLHPVGRRSHDRATAGQILDECSEFGVQARPDTAPDRSSNSSMSIRPRATALCRRRNVPLRSASEMRSTAASVERPGWRHR